MGNREIILTPAELDKIKEDARHEGKYRERVLSSLEKLKGIPNRVTKLETKVGVMMWGIPVIVAVVGLVWRVAKWLNH